MKHLLKSILLIFTLILSSSAFTTGANATPGDLEDWHLVGGQGVSEGAVGDVSLAIHDDIPYVAIQDTFPEFGISVMRYIDGAWEYFGERKFSPGGASSLSIAFLGDTPYVGFLDSANGNKATVMRYVNGSWEIFGEAGFTATAVSQFSMNSNGSELFIAYVNANKAIVLRHDGAEWEELGTPGFTPGTVRNLQLKYGATAPFIFYTDQDNSTKGNVMKFNGSKWESVGVEGFTPPSAEDSALGMDGDTPYVSFQDSTVGSKLSVMKFDGDDWVYVGEQGLSNALVFVQTAMEISNGTPYVLFPHIGLGLKLILFYFDGEVWQKLGSEGFTPHATNHNRLVFNGLTPYVAFYDFGVSGKLSVMKHGEIDEWIDQVEIPVEGSDTTVSITTPIGTNITCSTSEKVNPNKPDGNFTYPLGLLNFCYSTINSNDQVTLTFVTSLKADEVVARKFSPSTGLYSELPGAQISEVIHKGEPALQLTYTIVDNGELDSNPNLGEVDDPVGLALLNIEQEEPTGDGAMPGPPNTGVKHNSWGRSIGFILLGTIIGAGAIVADKKLTVS